MFCDPEACDPSVWTFDTVMPATEGRGQASGADRGPTARAGSSAAAAAPARRGSTGGQKEWEASSHAPVVVDWPSDAQYDKSSSEDEGSSPWFGNPFQADTRNSSAEPSSVKEFEAWGDVDDADDLQGLMPADMFQQAGGSSYAQSAEKAGWQPAAARVGKAGAACDTDNLDQNSGVPPALDLLALDLELDESWGRAATGSNSSGGADTPPPPTTDVAAQQLPDDSLNCDELFSDRNFKKGTSGLSERGRGAFAAAVICLLERGGTGTGHVHVIRGGAHVDCWQLNRMPGRTDACLRFVNEVLVSILGLKAFSSWRALARSLGDTRDYLPPRHWKCLELKGGGVSDATKQPWQSYRARAGHFDRLATELESLLLSCGDLLSSQAKDEAAASPTRKGKSRQEQFATKRAAVLAAEGAKAQSSPEGYKTKDALKLALQNKWSEVLLLMPVPSSTSARSRKNAPTSAGSRGKAAAVDKYAEFGFKGAEIKRERTDRGDDRPGADFYSYRPAIKSEPDLSADGPITSKLDVKSRSGRAVKSPRWMKDGSSFVTGESMNDEIHQAGGSNASHQMGGQMGGVKSGTKGGGGGAAKRRRRSGVGAAAAAALLG